MKFVCDNCQAKYQIGDDKVAGKTVRMKCRKCGYNIKVSPPAPEGGGDGAAHQGAGDRPSMDPPVHAAPPSQPAAGPASVAAPASQVKPGWDPEEESTSI